MNSKLRSLLLPTGLVMSIVLSACGGSGHQMGADASSSASMSAMPGHDMNDMGTSTTGTHGMEGMDGMDGDGLSATVSGYTLSVEEQPMTDMAMPVKVKISKAGAPVTKFIAEQTKLMHLYLVRSDLTGFQHVHPTMDAAGAWSTPPIQVTPGSYRLYTQFIPGGLTEPIVLSQPLTAGGPGAEKTQPVPTPDPGQATGAGDGYTVTVDGMPKAGAAGELELAITRSGNPVTELQPYLDTYAHVTAIHAGDLAFAHLHPEEPVTAGVAPKALKLHAQLPRPGAYRLFVQFQTAGALHTVPVTIAAN